jgi:thiol-disulfide isomerase/thioredoxin
VNAEGRVRAPELTGAVGWLNVPAPLTLSALRGKVVLLDFWTYGCVNCMHILPDLKRLEAKYGDALVVIGIHSAKFSNERLSENLRRVVVRYEIEHPVANDAHFEIWKRYGARAWPTQVLIDPEGYVVATASGEGHAEGIDRAVAAVIQVFDEQGKISRASLPMTLERERLATSLLAFPGKVLADEASGRLFIADSNHNRVLVADMDGKVHQVIGGPDAGNADGSFATARFFRPQGLALQNSTLFVADTENHVVHAADLEHEQVQRVAGTGVQAVWGGGGGRARETALSSPWDLVFARGLLFVAMAGTHQIWVIDLDRQLALPYAGSGREARIDGPTDDAAFAQPSGLAVDGSTLYAADSESNIIRAVELPPVNQVRTLAGGDLFEFGDRDGTGDEVRLQHPLGVAFARGRLYIADTYNHRVKVLTTDGRVRTFAGDGQPGAADGAPDRARFYEPGGLSATSAHLFVADTNNHAIRRIGLDDGAVDTVVLTFSPSRQAAP